MEERSSTRLSKRRASLLMVLLLSSTLLLAPSACANDSALVSNIPQNVDKYLKAHLELDQFSGSVLMAQGNQILFEKSYGMADLEHQVENDLGTKYLLGSVTKQFTAAGILLLQGQGKLEVNDPISNYISGYPKGNRITIHNLLTHSSGIPNYTQFQDFSTQMRIPTDPQEFVDLLSKRQLDFEPGENVAYSNSNYVLLGVIIEEVTGVSYDRFIEENIFQPLGMKSSGYAHNRPIIKKRAEGYSLSEGKLINAPYIHMSVPYAAGALYSTVGDIHKWVRALSGQALLNQDLKEQMFTPHEEGFGYGWLIDELFEYRRVHHFGSVNGFKAAVNWYPDLDLEIIVLSNYEHAPVDQISRDLAAVAFGRNYKIPKKKVAIELDPEIMKKYTGTYKAEEGIQFNISFDHGLFVKVPGQPKLQIHPMTKTDFFTKEVDAELEFVVNDRGKVTKLVFTQAGQKFEARKTE